MKTKEVTTYPISLNVNGLPYSIGVRADEILIDVLRNRLGFTSVKRSCDSGECGACTVILDGKAVYSCLQLAVEADGKKILTIEGLSGDGQLHPLQKAFLEHGAVQCGFCTPGMVLSAKAYLDENPKPSPDEIKRALQGNLCRCTGYVKILDAVQSVAPASKKTRK